MPDRAQVIEIPMPVSSPELRPLLEELRQSVGLASSLVVVPLVRSEAGVAVTAASGTGTAIVQSRTAVDFEDARIDQVRVVGWGGSSASGHVVRVIDSVSGTTLCEAALPTPAAGAVDGAWALDTAVEGGARRVEVRVVGNGAATQTLHALDLQCRTVRVVRR